MDQKKIGEFISKCRKEKNLTQQELADILHVTDRAISNWETGRRMPDVSFYKPLCEVLDISINELLMGEKIEKEKQLSTSEEHLIHALEVNEISHKKMISLILLFIISIFLLIGFIGIIYYHEKYPSIPIYRIEAWYQDSDNSFTLNKEYIEESYDIYFYGLEKVNFCTHKTCYEMKDAFKHHQINQEKIKEYLESEVLQDTIQKHIYYDGGTTTYQSEHYTIIFCNTTEGNKDIYIGTDNMLDELEGAYCGHEKSDLKKFTRTYSVEAIYEDTVPDYINVTLRIFQGEVATVKIDSSSSLQVGKNYEFTFFTYEMFEDTISNIFENSTIVKIKETDKLGMEQVQEKIIVNDQYVSKEELNEIREVSMKIKEGTLTSSSATIIITDLSGGKWLYGSSYSIQKYVYGEWKELEYAHDTAINAMAYYPDPNGVLEMKLDWKYMYGSLLKGKYRIVKYALPEVERAVGEDDKKYFSVEFDL